MDGAGGFSPLAHLDAAGHAFIERVVSCARRYLDADVSFVAEVVGSEKVIRETAGPAGDAGLAVGTTFSLQDTYCGRVLRHELPEVIYDAQADAQARDIPLTARLGIRSYMGVPIVLPDGRALGTLCCVNFEPAPERRVQDLRFMHFLADLISQNLLESTLARDLRQQRDGAIRAVLAAGGPTMVFQPIVALDGGRTVGFEALARFDSPFEAPPDAWFCEAWAIGLGLELELAAVRNTLAVLAHLPEPMFLTVNASPVVVADPAFIETVRGAPLHRLVVEITENWAVEDYGTLLRAMRQLRGSGVRIAIDDVGAGYATLSHVLKIAPEITKLDITLTRAIDGDPAKQAMAVGIMAFAERTGVMVIAEGVETPAEATMLGAVGVRFAQGFLFGRPGPLPASMLERA